MWNRKLKKEFQRLNDEMQELYEEVSAMWYQLEELKEKKNDLQ